MKLKIANIIVILFFDGIIGFFLIVPLFSKAWFMTPAIIVVFIVAWAIEYSSRPEVYNPKTKTWEKDEGDWSD